MTLIGTVLILEHINTFLVCCKILGLDINVPLLQKNVEKIKMSHFFSLLKDFASVADLGSDFFPSQMRMRSTNLSFLTQKIALGNIIQLVHPRSGSKIKGSKRYRIPDPYTQHYDCYHISVVYNITYRMRRFGEKIRFT